MNGSGDYQAVIATPMGRIGIRMSDKAVSALDYLPADAAEQAPVNAATEAVVTQLIAYFHHPLASFNVPLAPAGTAFQQRVWVALQAIPTGSVLSYGELAQRLDTAPRAIGGACRSNPIPILIPCHRVVSRQGLGGYAGEVKGDPLAIKRWLLRHEGLAFE
ncbi:Methylated-DNA/protein-cysteine methyltransferase [Candidatus Competibacter denitrificans Run_A_D11]|uniref:methylated-DNA--[protein]-cysteine S-methyltransferase n=1 Tax=Candidatus Competibacter denitrificans Run_A_D11 TaxID=1400863 RepID=W6M6D1_9GAMM|nr:methylated-DNA--[protein]-cysteine S-methyltransferase [Candidatus Competibacter denitrificans]CDI02169.1 Methylated-DNA/protein-cysteine methyltransferase [Candidatus Competibacter denitrificans Run_A_D11]HRC68440.1 methylated-DNA--[protein]-cysteine S-methyltransferase [Candidatus Competibacter denitrificans]